MSSKGKKQSLRQQDPFLAWLQHVGLSVFYGLIFMFLVANIILSQYMPEQYFNLFTRKKDTVVQVLKRGQELPYFGFLKPEVQEVISDYDQVINSEVRKQMQDVEKLEQLLALNPDARDVLYALYVLYEHEGESEKARSYLERARAIDPVIGVGQEDM